MAPPAKGTPEYETYLEAQRERRRKVRAREQRDALRAKARSLLRQARVEEANKWRPLLDEAVLRKNRALRRLNKEEHLAAWENRRNERLSHKLEVALARNKELTAKLSELEGQNTRLQKLLNQWELWWAWLSAKAPRNLLAKVKRLGRTPPRRLRDGGWGGGQ